MKYKSKYLKFISFLDKLNIKDLFLKRCLEQRCSCFKLCKQFTHYSTVIDGICWEETAEECLWHFLYSSFIGNNIFDMNAYDIFDNSDKIPVELIEKIKIKIQEYV